ncbi:MAG: molybdate ABC transporter permease subunit [Actinomycetota bacterium]
MNGEPRPAAGLNVLALACVAFVALPVVGLAARAPWSDLDALWSPGARTALRLSIVVAAGSVAIALVLGVPAALVLARARFPGSSVARGIVLMPMVLPPVVGGVGLLMALGRRGILGRPLSALGIELPFTTGAAVLAAAFVSIPLLILAVEAGVRSLDPRLEQAAAAMGASRWYVLRRVTLPLLRPQILAGCVLVAARSLGEFGATITFAGNIGGRTQTLPLSVFETLQSDPGGAILQSLLLVALSLVAIVALRGRLSAR